MRNVKYKIPVCRCRLDISTEKQLVNGVEFFTEFSKVTLSDVQKAVDNLFGKDSGNNVLEWKISNTKSKNNYQ